MKIKNCFLKNLTELKSIIKEKEYLEKIALAAQERAQTFSYSAFNEHLNALLQ